MIFVEYNNDYCNLLEEYFRHPLTPFNNSSHETFKTHLYDGVNGILGMLVDNSNIVAVSSALIINENNIKSCKYPHRLHVRSDYSYISNKFIDQHWDPFLFQWLEKNKIENVYCTFNEDNVHAFFWAAIRHSRRFKNTKYINDFGKSILNQNWYVYPKIIREKNTWQYLIYSTPNNKWFYNHRREKSMPIDIKDNLDKKFVFVSEFGWQI